MQHVSTYNSHLQSKLRTVNALQGGCGKPFTPAGRLSCTLPRPQQQKEVANPSQIHNLPPQDG